MLFLVSFISFLSLLCVIPAEEAPIKIVLEKFYACEGKKYNETEYTDVEFEQYNRTTAVMNAKLHVNKEMSEMLNLFVDVSKCDSKQQTDSCQHLATEHLQDICVNMNNSSRPYKGFVDSMAEFDRKCPWKTGVYTIAEYIMSLKDLEEMPAITGYYILTFRPFDADKQIGCNVGEISIVKKRRSS
ncbi:uncharacterized protein [Anabrus simplex]|uniref:uncharacterized protein n=1 Tax=Anabrus simplex TaxID=316456 RepID=UPI0035A37C37